MADSNIINSSEQLMNDPSSQLFANLADFYRENGLLAEAIAMCQSGLGLQPDNTEGRLVLAKCYLATNEYDKARAEAVKVLSVHSENAEAKKILSEVDSSAKTEKVKPDTTVSRTSLSDAIPSSQAINTSKSEVEETRQDSQKQVPGPAVEPSVAVRKETAVPVSPLPLMSEKSAKEKAPETVETLTKLSKEEKIESGVEEIKPKVAVAREVMGQAATPPVIANRILNQSDKQTNYSRILNDLAQTHQVNFCLLVDESGYVVDEAYSKPQDMSTDAEISAALTASVFKTAAQAIAKVRLGELERIVIETDREKIFLRPAGRMMLMVSSETTAKVGLVMVNSKRAAEQIDSLSRKNP